MDNLKIQENISLKEYTSMHVGGVAKYFLEVKDLSELKSAIEFAKINNLKIFVLGGGSNVLISDSGFNGLVIKISLFGVRMVETKEDEVKFEVGAGESWDGFVQFAVESGLYGIENLSHIPGTVGASVVQNIGAYGQEVSSTIFEVRVINIETQIEEVWKKEEMDFSYRKSRLNNSEKDKGKFVVTSIFFSLKKQGVLSIDYADLKKYFLENSLELNLRNVRKAVIEVRNSKFPYPDSPEHGTVGSFWNAEVVDLNTYENIILKLEKIGFNAKAEEMKNKKSAFTVAQGFKVVPGLFIEILGYKGKEFENIRILKTHAGIINNYTGRATSREIIDLSAEVTKKVYDEFGIKLKIEPELVGEF